ncbi:TetR/AcrR family transcriptional regulator [Rhodococcus sp. ACPA4]|uniref:TetR/AcrR family transcriptional regulator n=1 Tax=Rhodococcus sp. ACPA4 TaxID=2028571 RepID=UPI0015CD03EA|nr:TetR/AcrR family transcriptional regulator [Rhodococcus sp. ACPA4]
MSTEDKLLDAAAAIVERRDYVLPSVAEIAREAGVTRPTVYAYFTSSIEVFAAAVARVRNRVLAIQESADTTSATATFRSTLVAMLDIHVEHCGLLAVLAEQARIDEQMRTLWHDIHDRSIRRHARFIDRLAESGHARPTASGLIIAEAVNGISTRFAYLVIENPDRREELTGELVALHRALVGLPVNNEAARTGLTR